MRFKLFQGLPWVAWSAVRLAAAVLVLSSCMTDRVAGGSTSTETGTKISLAGRVVDKNNAGLAGVVVELQRTGLIDTTDVSGRYSLNGKVNESGSLETSALVRAARSAAIALDTLLVKQHGQELRSLPIFKWVDTLPDIRIIQRDISGKLLQAPVPIGRIEAVISGGEIPADQPVVVPLYHFALSSSYTGFAYFRNTTTIIEYAVFVRVFDTAGKLMGRSPKVPFNSQAGNIPIPDFEAGNALPKAFAGNDTALQGGGKVVLRGTATAAPGGQITRLEWDAGGTGFFRQYPEEFILDMPKDTGTFLWILRAWDNDGNSAVDTVILRSVGPARCGTYTMTFYTEGQVCSQWWEADHNGLATTITFEVGDTAIVKVFGTPSGLPLGYTGPYPPAAQYVATVRPQGKKGATQIKVTATESGGIVKSYNPITVTRE